jgi:DNA replication protein DnaD
MGKVIKVWDGTTWQQVSVALPDALSVDGIQTITNKTISLANNTITGSISQFNSALSGADFATLAGSETLTNKSISGSTNTISNIGNSALTNSAITINGTSVSLGSSVNIVGETFNPFLLMGV